MFYTYENLKNYDFSISVLLPFYQGSTLSLPNVVYYPYCFQTACKRLWRLWLVAGTSDSKNPEVYYLFLIRTPTVLVFIMYQFDLHFFKPQDSIRRPVWDGYLDRIVGRTQKTFLWKSFSQRLRFLHYFGKFRMCVSYHIIREDNVCRKISLMSNVRIYQQQKMSPPPYHFYHRPSFYVIKTLW